MPSGRLLRQLIKSGSEGNVQAFRQFSQEIIDEERQKQHHLLANDLERILYGQHKASNPPRSVPKVPEDRSNGVPLIWIAPARRSLEDLVLSDDVLQVFEDIAMQYDRIDTLQSYGLRPTSRLLFYGPPGNGKTATAEALAFRLERELAIVRLDSLVSSYLGETASNLQQVFEFSDKYPLVVLFDEFDAIARERDSSDDHGELKRVVSAVLQMLDRFSGKSLLIAATNHEQVLDYAIWRRFDEMVKFEPPSTPQIMDFLELRFRGLRHGFDIREFSPERYGRGWSFADLQRVVERVYKQVALAGAEFLERTALERAFRREAKRLQLAGVDE